MKTFFDDEATRSHTVYFAIIELEDGLSIVEIKPHQTPEDAALKEGGTLVDPGPYTAYDDALDALADLEAEDEEG